MNNSNNQLGFYSVKFFIYLLGIFQAALYTPVIISIALFIIFIPMFFQAGLTNPLFQFFPDGQYGVSDILSIYGTYAFLLSLLIVAAEIITRKRWRIRLKKKIIFISLVLCVGYSFLLIFFLTKTDLPAYAIALVFIPFFMVSLFAAALNALLGGLIEILHKTADGLLGPSSFVKRS